MRLPRKVTPYTQSVLTLFPKILKELRDGPLPAAVLFRKIVHHCVDTADFFNALDCLYALRAINLGEDGLIYAS